MSYNLNEVKFDYNKNWINSSQNRKMHHSKEGASFMTGLFWVMVILTAIIAFM